jgi:hypothetical protein
LVLHAGQRQKVAGLEVSKVQEEAGLFMELKDFIELKVPAVETPAYAPSAFRSGRRDRV